MHLVTAIVGAAILVNTVVYVQGTLQLGKLEYGWVMAAFRIGATVASSRLGSFSPILNKTVLTSLGAILITAALLPGNWVGLGGLFLIMGNSWNWTNPSECVHPPIKLARPGLRCAVCLEPFLVGLLLPPGWVVRGTFLGMGIPGQQSDWDNVLGWCSYPVATDKS